jgi:hypothetical protein
MGPSGLAGTWRCRRSPARPTRPAPLPRPERRPPGRGCVRAFWARVFVITEIDQRTVVATYFWWLESVSLTESPRLAIPSKIPTSPVAVAGFSRRIYPDDPKAQIACPAGVLGCPPIPWDPVKTERVGFEPTEGCPSNDFESFAFDHSATSPALPWGGWRTSRIQWSSASLGVSRGCSESRAGRWHASRWPALGCGRQRGR